MRNLEVGEKFMWDSFFLCPKIAVGNWVIDCFYCHKLHTFLPNLSNLRQLFLVEKLW